MLDDHKSGTAPSNARQAAARAYRQRGWKPVPIPTGMKNPNTSEWQSQDFPDSKFALPGNVGVQLGAVSGGLCDVDLDCREARELAPYFLPETDAVFGRKSSLKAHWLYVSDMWETASRAVTTFDDPEPPGGAEHGACMVEIRTGAVSKGGKVKGAISMFPPSKHPDGERVRWDRDGEPAMVAAGALMESVSLLAVAALLARHWPEGERHRAALVVGGILARVGMAAEDIKLFVERVARVAGDDDPGERGQSAAAAVGRLANDEPTTGYPAMQKLWGERIAKRIAEWLDYDGQANTSNGAHKATADAAATSKTKREIKVAGGQIARIVDEAQDALLQTDLPIFVRGGRLVEPITVEREAADKRKTTTTIFAPISKEKLSYLLNKEAATFTRKDERSNIWVTIDPPPKVAETLLTLRAWRFLEVVGIVGAPTMRPDGSILSDFGYDSQTRLWCDADIELPPIPDKPTRQQAVAALRLYRDLLSGFPFAAATDEAVALAGVLTVVLRGAFDLCPMFAAVAHDVGNGKSYLFDLLATVVTGRYCPVITPGGKREELEKRLGAILLEGGSVVSLDNISFDLESDLLCQIVTQPIVKTRILGQSAVPECEWRGTLFITGNNIRIIGDLVRRTLIGNLDAGVERPELRTFKFDPIARVHGDRGAYIAAAITIARAYDAAGRPAPGCRPLGGFSAWSHAVRYPLLWLGIDDPVTSMETARAADPERAAAYELVMRWAKYIGIGNVVSVREIIDIVNESKKKTPGVELADYLRAKEASR